MTENIPPKFYRRENIPPSFIPELRERINGIHERFRNAQKSEFEDRLQIGFYIAVPSVLIALEYYLFMKIIPNYFYR